MAQRIRRAASPCTGFRGSPRAIPGRRHMAERHKSVRRASEPTSLRTVLPSVGSPSPSSRCSNSITSMNRSVSATDMPIAPIRRRARAAPAPGATSVASTAKRPSSVSATLPSTIPVRLPRLVRQRVEQRGPAGAGSAVNLRNRKLEHRSLRWLAARLARLLAASILRLARRHARRGRDGAQRALPEGFNEPMKLALFRVSAIALAAAGNIGLREQSRAQGRGARPAARQLDPAGRRQQGLGPEAARRRRPSTASSLPTTGIMCRATPTSSPSATRVWSSRPSCSSGSIRRGNVASIQAHRQGAGPRPRSVQAAARRRSAVRRASSRSCSATSGPSARPACRAEAAGLTSR